MSWRLGGKDEANKAMTGKAPRDTLRTWGKMAVSSRKM